jgi:hypothetical protein
MTNQDFSNGESETPFSQRVREMSSDGFESCLTLCFEHVLIALTRSQSVHKFISDVLHIEITNKSGKPVVILVDAKEVTIENNNNDNSYDKDRNNSGGSSVSNRRTVSSSQVVEQSINNANNMNRNKSNNYSKSNNSSSSNGHISGLQSNIDLTQLQALSKTCIGTACDLSQRSIQQLISLRK